LLIITQLYRNWLSLEFSRYDLSAILIIKIVFLKFHLRWGFKKNDFGVSSPLALETPKSFS